MKYLAIDYGKKYIGLATSDDSGIMAFPLSVINNTNSVISDIDKICKDKDIQNIVMGESVDNNGNKNKIAKEIEEFSKILETKLNVKIFFEKEQFTSVHARYDNVTQKGRVDSSAATLILQRFLDRINK